MDIRYWCMNCGSKNTSIMIWDIDDTTIKKATMNCKDCGYKINFQEVKRE